MVFQKEDYKYIHRSNNNDDDDTDSHWTFTIFHPLCQVLYIHCLLFSLQEPWEGEGRRWQRNRMGRPLSLLQIHWKIIWTVNKYHKTTSECWWRTSGTHCLQKEVRKYKGKKRDKRVRDGDLSWEGSRKREVPKHQEILSPAGLWGVLESQRAT